MKHPTTARLLIACAAALALGAAAASRPAAERGERVELEKRVDNGAYEESAYSFRYASQDVSEHRNEVDLVFNGCGNLHIAEGGAANRVAKTAARKLADVEQLPEEGWSTRCFTPEEDAVYVMQIDSDVHRFAVKFRIVDAKHSEVTIEWLPLRLPPPTERGTLGQCAGPHECE